MLRKPLTLAVLSAALVAGAVSVSVSVSGPAYARAPMIQTNAPGYYRIHIGHFEITALSDGTDDLSMDQLLTHTTPAAVKAALAANFLKSPVETSVNAYLVNTGDRLVLIDTGAGTFFGPTVGKLAQNLKAAGYRPDQVDDVFITHMHPDHIGGLLAGKAAGKIGSKVAAFPNAVIHINKADTDFWLSQANQDRAPDSAKVFFQDAVAAVAPYVTTGRLKTFAGSAELVPGIRAAPIAGHTAGHTGYLIESDGQSLLMWGDVVHLAAMQFADPSVTIAYDNDADEAAADRVAAFKDAAQKGYLVASSHIAFPGLGHVRAKGEAFEWVPVDYSAAR